MKSNRNTSGAVALFYWFRKHVGMSAASANRFTRETLCMRAWKGGAK